MVKREFENFLACRLAQVPQEAKAELFTALFLEIFERDERHMLWPDEAQIFRRILREVEDWGGA